MSVYVTALLVCLALAVALVQLLRTRRIREKYAALWIVLTVAVIVVAAFPQLAFWLSDLVGVRTPVNLVFSLAIVVLLAVCVQLSAEVSSLEEETRTLAEEIALVRLDVRSLQMGGESPVGGGGTATAGGDGAAALPPAGVPDPAAHGGSVEGGR